MIIEIEGKEYEIDVNEIKLKGKEVKEDGSDLLYAIVRTYSAGVFAGYVVSKNGKEVIMKDARRLWYWKGASSLSELAMHGVTCPAECKFPCEVDSVILTEAIEILPCTKKAKKCIQSVPEWKQRT